MTDREHSIRQPRPIPARPRRVPITPAIFADALKELETAADMINHVGYILVPALGSKWRGRTLKMYRLIMASREAARKDYVQDRELRATGTGSAPPDAAAVARMRATRRGLT